MAAVRGRIDGWWRHSTESDSMRFRSRLVSKPWLGALLQATSSMSLPLTPPSPLLTYTFAQTNLSLSLFACDKAADHTFRIIGKPEGTSSAPPSALGVTDGKVTLWVPVRKQSRFMDSRCLNLWDL